MPNRHDTDFVYTNKTHPLEYGIWRGIRKRCGKSSTHNYSNYGGRGIKVCNRWRKSFNVFMVDMGPRPSKQHSIDRIDNDGDYEPSNCRWATAKEQARNRRDTNWITYEGKTKCITDWAVQLGMSVPCLRMRIARLGVVGAIEKPVEPNWRMLSYKGRTQSLSDWAREIGVKRETLAWRIKNHGLEKAMTESSDTKKYITWNGKTMGLSEWARQMGMQRSSLEKRIKMWGLEKAMSTPRRNYKD